MQSAPEYWRDLDPYWRGAGSPMRRYFHPDGSITAESDDKVWGGHEASYTIVTGLLSDGKVREHYVRINRWPKMSVHRNPDWSWVLRNHLYCYTSIPNAGTGPSYPISWVLRREVKLQLTVESWELRVYIWNLHADAVSVVWRWDICVCRRILGWSIYREVSILRNGGWRWMRWMDKINKLENWRQVALPFFIYCFILFFAPNLNKQSHFLFLLTKHTPWPLLPPSAMKCYTHSTFIFKF